MYAAAGRIVTVGDGYRERLLARGVPAEKIAVIPNGVDVRHFAPLTTSPADSLPLANGDKFVCRLYRHRWHGPRPRGHFAGRQKLKSRERSDVEFWIVGDGADRSRLQHEAESSGLTNVFFTGLVPKTCMPGLIAACNACLVHLKQAELFETVIPSKIFEIMAMNVPVIMGVRGQARTIVAGGGCRTGDDSGKRRFADRRHQRDSIGSGSLLRGPLLRDVTFRPECIGAADAR